MYFTNQKTVFDDVSKNVKISRSQKTASAFNFNSQEDPLMQVLISYYSNNLTKRGPVSLPHL